MLDKTQSHITWCNAYIEEYRKNNQYDPYAALTKAESRDQAMFSLCCDYLYGIETALEKVNAMFEANRNNIAFKEARA